MQSVQELAATRETRQEMRRTFIVIDGSVQWRFGLDSSLYSKALSAQGKAEISIDSTDKNATYLTAYLTLISRRKEPKTDRFR